MKRYRIRTVSGSIYVVEERDDGTFWFTSNNVPCRQSQKLPEDVWWEIERPVPWPVELGGGVPLRSIHFTDHAHPDRCPGGGKHTSNVASVESV
jgi:hypothetical protein